MNVIYIILAFFISIPVNTAPHKDKALKYNDLIYANYKRWSFSKAKILSKDSYYLNAYTHLLKHANQALTKKTNPVVNKTQTPPSGDKHDYLSLAPYWWPNPSTKNGLPWLRKDGQINPKTMGDHTDKLRLSNMFNDLENLTLAYFITDNIKYANKAKQIIKVWFIDDATKMNPSVEYGQGIPGLSTGRPFGLIEFNHIDALITTLQVLEINHIIDTSFVKKMKLWTADLVDWMTKSELGMIADKTKNNHGTWYDYKVIGLQIYAGNLHLAKKRLEDIKSKRISGQIDENGFMAHEMKRTNSVNYVTLNLRGLCLLSDLGKKYNIDLFNFKAKNGAGIKKALLFLKPYVEGSKVWTWKQGKYGCPEKAITSKMKPELFGVLKALQPGDFIKVSQNVHQHMKSTEVINFPYNFNNI